MESNNIPCKTLVHANSALILIWYYVRRIVSFILSCSKYYEMVQYIVLHKPILTSSYYIMRHWYSLNV